MGEGGWSRRAVVRRHAAVPQLPPVEGAAAGGASREAQPVGRGGVGDAVGWGHRVLLASGRHGNTAKVKGRRTIQSGFILRVLPLQMYFHTPVPKVPANYFSVCLHSFCGLVMCPAGICWSQLAVLRYKRQRPITDPVNWLLHDF